MKIVLMRHAESESNVTGIVDSDPHNSAPLTQKGKEQAHAAAESLKEQHFDAIFISQLIRTKQTGDIINQFHHKELLADARLNEVQLGLNGMTWKEALKIIKWDGGTWTYVPEGGETFEEEVARVTSFYEDLLQKPYQSVLIVSHGGPLLIIEGIITNKDIRDIKMLRKAHLRAFEVNT